MPKNTFQKCINPEVNVIAQLDIEVASRRSYSSAGLPLRHEGFPDGLTYIYIYLCVCVCVCMCVCVCVCV